MGQYDTSYGSYCEAYQHTGMSHATCVVVSVELHHFLAGCGSGKLGCFPERFFEGPEAVLREVGTSGNYGKNVGIKALNIP